ncbi:MAG: HisA/HisF-related TIM barrel protein, partial [Terrimesophilobacter sp.]
MAFPRLMPVLLVHSGALQKSQKFGSWKYVGDVLNAIRIFNEKDVDEVVVLDVDASREKRGPDFALLEQLAGECFMP